MLEALAGLRDWAAGTVGFLVAPGADVDGGFFVGEPAEELVPGLVVVFQPRELGLGLIADPDTRTHVSSRMQHSNRCGGTTARHNHMDFKAVVLRLFRV